ncbi:hypothetical protein M409DRAFT_69277 [Zasmidium cellare ATCC 36951]|uniref:Glycoside hydrolase family 43 protein n=1 Tax=Zasmidium cellare ATCC 36951 TaxID=1080233 RepID=A0A6A6C4U4_ZASCE|nr:uncharacterized protein M409DRAFT_69277 [Zasmidium cellare ATCC 36951]KAF2162035.1 hypothetical protein M409DRAFT_69277 [Zasmidium cellare ATCC 36951]
MMLLAYLVVLQAAAVAVSQKTFSTVNWNGQLDAESGVLQSLKPKSDSSYDFSPLDYYHFRRGNGNYHTGDVALRWRVAGQSGWNDFNTAANRSNGRKSGAYFKIVRDWGQIQGDLALNVTVVNPSASQSIELGSFGFPIEFNNIFLNRTADEVTAKCSLVDPYVGLHAGYAQVTRLTGTGPNLIITPLGLDTKFEAWRFLDEFEGAPLYYRETTFEGLYSLEVLSKAYAENEWNSTQPWNIPTSMTLAANKSVTFGLRFSSTQNLYDIEATVSSVGRSVAVGIPGYVLPQDINGQLFLKHNAALKSISVEPQGVLQIESSGTRNQWNAYAVSAGSSAFGRARVTVVYTDGLTQTIHYTVTDTSINTANKMASFFTEKSWYTDTSDPFKRAYSIISYDYEAGAQVLQDDRVWIAGIADEAGSVYEAIAFKTSVHPNPAQVEKLEQMALTSIWGQLQEKDGETKYGVKRSLFFYEPNAVPGFKYTIDSGWDKAAAFSVWRAYDYVHVSALYYSLYRANIASPGILTKKPALWYLEQAYHTAMASQAKYKNGTDVTAYADTGLMGETMWTHILTDLKIEGKTAEYNNMSATMKARQHVWSTQSSPFGSEMAWDSTGQEPIYSWSRYFNDTATIDKTLNSIRGYMPTIRQIERMIHHYGSGANSVPLLDSYKYNKEPSSAAALYDLRVGYGGHMGTLSNVNQDGFAATAFHSMPDLLKWDGYSGDYGPNYMGHIHGACSFLVQHPEFGWLAFGGNIQTSGSSRCTYIAALGLEVRIDSGRISNVNFDSASNTASLDIETADSSASTATNMTYQDTLGKNVVLNTGGLDTNVRGHQIPFGQKIQFSLGPAHY